MLFLEVQGGPKFFMPRMIQWYSGGIAAGTPELEAAFAEQQLILGGIAAYKRAMPNQLHHKKNGDYSHDKNWRTDGTGFFRAGSRG